MNRYLDSYFFYIKRDGKFTPVCLSDMTEGERREVLENTSKELLMEVASYLANRLKDIGNETTLYREVPWIYQDGMARQHFEKREGKYIMTNNG